MWKKYFILFYYRFRKGKYWIDRIDRNKELFCRIYVVKRYVFVVENNY